MALLDEVFAYIKKKYGTEPEYLWMRFHGQAVFRHQDNGKLFALVTDAPGLPGEAAADVLNVRMGSSVLADLLVQQEGYLRCRSMRGGSWISVMLDGTVPFADICRWIDESFMATGSAKARQKARQKARPPKEWIIPANTKYYDVVSAFEAADEIDWKQGAGIKKGDTVYMYVAAPVSAVLYKCLVTKTDIPFRFDGGNVRIRSLMRIRLLKRYRPDQFTFERLGREYGVFAVRGPRGIPDPLIRALG